MPAGDAFSPRQRADIERAVAYAHAEGRLRVSVYVGELAGDSRFAAESLHLQLTDAADAVLVAVDPAGRRLEVVTGSRVLRRLDDRAAALATLAMTASFQAGDLVGGIVSGVRQLAEHSRAPRSLHSAAQPHNS